MQPIRTSPVLSTGSLTGDNVFDKNGKQVGHLKEIMVDTETGKVAYGVLSFGGLLGMGDKLFAMPWSSILVDTNKERLIVDVDEKRLQDADGFDKNSWPDFADATFREKTYKHWNAKPYWN